MSSDREELFQLCQQYLQKNNLEDFELLEENNILYVIDPEGRELSIDFDDNKKDYARKNKQGGQELLIKALSGEKKMQKYFRFNGRSGH